MPQENARPEKNAFFQESVIQSFALAFLHEHAASKYAFSESEQAIINIAKDELMQADAVMIRLGGKAGRLGESVVGTGLLEGTLLALDTVGKIGIEIHIVIDAAMRELFDERLYQAKYWPQITVHTILPEESQGIPVALLKQVKGKVILIVDLHGAHDGMPCIQIEDAQGQGHEESVKRIVTLSDLFRVGIRSYAQRGRQRRYADFVEELFGLPSGAIDGEHAQPTLLLSAQDEARYPALAREYGLDGDALLVICFFQSVVIAKCYCRWDEVLALLCEYFVRHFPRQKIDFLIACGPDEQQPEGLKRADLEHDFANFSGVNANVRILARITASLLDLAILTKRALFALSNDTGPSHIAGALRVSTITPYLPGNIYSKKVWAATPWQHGVTLEPNPFSYQQIEAAVLWNHTEIIDSIPPEDLVSEILKNLPA